jgi:hypothetical protein
MQPSKSRRVRERELLKMDAPLSFKCILAAERKFFNIRVIGSNFASVTITACVNFPLNQHREINTISADARRDERVCVHFQRADAG